MLSKHVLWSVCVQYGYYHVFQAIKYVAENNYKEASTRIIQWKYLKPGLFTNYWKF